jgi:hypothetical protein
VRLRLAAMEDPLRTDGKATKRSLGMLAIYVAVYVVVVLVLRVILRLALGPNKTTALLSSGSVAIYALIITAVVYLVVRSRR